MPGIFYIAVFCTSVGLQDDLNGFQMAEMYYWFITQQKRDLPIEFVLNLLTVLIPPFRPERTYLAPKQVCVM